MQEKLKVFLETRSASLGLQHHGAVALQKPLSFHIYSQWLQEGLHGDMKYLSEHAPTKEEAQRRWPRARSAFVFAVPYFPHPAPSADFPLKQARLSLYARGRDYHHWFREKMEILATALREEYPDEEFLCFTDSAPVLERDLAYRAGLGWVGKNTCLIHPARGSLFFLGEIYSSLTLRDEIQPVHDFCGTCRRCLDACPTQALVEPRKLDARRCISYLTIESKELPPEDLRPHMGDWLFGCDICQTVCPWNQKVFGKNLSIAPREALEGTQERELIEDLRYLLTSSGKKLERDFAHTPLSRTGAFGLKRNALVVIGNRRLGDLREEVRALDEHPRLGELARWTLRQLEA